MKKAIFDQYLALSETIQDRAIVTAECQQELVSNQFIDVIFE